MARSQNSFIKQQKAVKRQKKQAEKLQKKIQKKDQETKGNLEDMMAYVDEFGNILDEPPPKDEKEKKNKDNN